MGLVGYVEVSAYNASKGAVRMFTKGIAIEFAQQENADPRQFAASRLCRHANAGRRVSALGRQGLGRKAPQDLVGGMIAQTPMGRLATSLKTRQRRVLPRQRGQRLHDRRRTGDGWRLDRTMRNDQ